MTVSVYQSEIAKLVYGRQFARKFHQEVVAYLTADPNSAASRSSQVPRLPDDFQNRSETLNKGDSAR